MLISLLLAVLAVYLALVGYLFVRQRTLLYYPDTNIESPQQYGLAGFAEHFVPSDGETIQLWYRQPLKGFPIIVYFHGNASHLGNRAGIYTALADKGFGVLAVSYRGYGKSTGTPSEEGFYYDARAALRFLTQEKNIPISRVLLFGESLGSGVAVQMAVEYPVAGLILQAPFTSVVTRAAELYFYIPVRLLLQDKFDSLSKIGKVKAPLLLFHGELDTVIPVNHGKTLFEAANQPKQAFFFPHVAHNDFDSSLISAHVLDFAKQYQLIE